MIVVYDLESAARALAGDLDPPLRAALEAELTLLTAGEHDLTGWTDIVLIQPGDTEADIVWETGVSPLFDPLSNTRSGEDSFEPAFDLLTLRRGVFRLVFTFGSTAATILLVPDQEGVEAGLLALCRKTSAEGN